MGRQSLMFGADAIHHLRTLGATNERMLLTIFPTLGCECCYNDQLSFWMESLGRMERWSLHTEVPMRPAKSSPTATSWRRCFANCWWNHHGILQTKYLCRMFGAYDDEVWNPKQTMLCSNVFLEIFAKYIPLKWVQNFIWREFKEERGVCNFQGISVSFAERSGSSVWCSCVNASACGKLYKFSFLNSILQSLYLFISMRVIQNTYGLTMIRIQTWCDRSCQFWLFQLLPWWCFHWFPQRLRWLIPLQQRLRSCILVPHLIPKRTNLIRTIVGMFDGSSCGVGKYC